MIIVGDIGNTETKICLINSKKKIFKRINLQTKNINLNLLKKHLKKNIFNKNKIQKCLFSSVVPKSFKIIKFFLESFMICNVTS